MRQINILAISGSLKSNSSNSGILRSFAKIAPKNVSIKIWEGLDCLPYFRPESAQEPITVSNFRKNIHLADAVIFCTPEYAFGVPGVLKNALDWMVFSGELNKKPVIAISASPLHTGGEKALASILLTLTALGSVMNAESSFSIGDIRNKLSNNGEVTDLKTLANMELVLNSLIRTIQKPIYE